MKHLEITFNDCVDFADCHRRYAYAVDTTLVCGRFTDAEKIAELKHFSELRIQRENEILSEIEKELHRIKYENNILTEIEKEVFRSANSTASEQI